MTDRQPSLIARPDTILGICQGLGEDLGVHPNLFRLAFAAAIYFVPVAAVATYLGLGLILALTHYLLPYPAAPHLVATTQRADLARAPQSDEESVALAA